MVTNLAAIVWASIVYSELLHESEDGGDVHSEACMGVSFFSLAMGDIFFCNYSLKL